MKGRCFYRFLSDWKAFLGRPFITFTTNRSSDAADQQPFTTAFAAAETQRVQNFSSLLAGSQKGFANLFETPSAD